jgi:hypothetical protein
MRCSDQGMWKELFALLVKAGDPLEIGLIDGPIVQVHQNTVLEKTRWAQKREGCDPSFLRFSGAKVVGRNLVDTHGVMNTKKHQNPCYNR